MQGISIADEGLRYIFRCIAEYSGQCFYLVLYLAALIFIFLKGDKGLRGIFIYPAVITVLTVYNPFLPVIINHFFDVNQEYYRLLWISPVIIAVSFALTLCISEFAKTSAAHLAYFIAAVLLLIGLGSFVYSDGYVRSENVYKLPQEIISVSEALHKDSDKAFPKAAGDFELSMQLRQYDATILLTGTREEYLNILNGTEVDEFIAEKQKHPNRILKVVVLNEELPIEEFKESMDRVCRFAGEEPDRGLS